MSFELTPKPILEIEIAQANRNLTALGIRMRTSGDFSFIPDASSQLDASYRNLLALSETSAFWAHHIGSKLNGADMLLQLVEEHPEMIEEDYKEMIGASQTETYKLLDARMKAVYEKSSRLEQASYIAFRDAAFSFGWSTNPDALSELHMAGNNLADLYTNLEGKPTFGQIIKDLEGKKQ